MQITDYANKNGVVKMFYIPVFFGTIHHFNNDTASEIVFSKASLPYLSTSDLFFSPWVRQPAPPMQPPTQAIPSIKFASRAFLLFLRSAILHASIPSQETGLNSKSSIFCSLIACVTASVRPPLLAKILPK